MKTTKHEEKLYQMSLEEMIELAKIERKYPPSDKRKIAARKVWARRKASNPNYLRYM